MAIDYISLKLSHIKRILSIYLVFSPEFSQGFAFKAGVHDDIGKTLDQVYFDEYYYQIELNARINNWKTLKK
jgi:hypothetical protein